MRKSRCNAKLPYKKKIPKNGELDAVLNRQDLLSCYFSIFEHCPTLLVVRKYGSDQRVKGGTMVFMHYVSKLVNNDVVYSLRRVLHQPPGKTYAVFCTAASKSGARTGYAY